MKKLTSLVLSLVILSQSLSISVFASGLTGDDNTGGGTGGVGSNNAYTWNENQQGYRFTLVDENGNRVSL